MSKAYDRELGMGRDITRRDFLNGVAVTVGGSMLSPQKLDKSADPWFGYSSPQEAYYPPAATGMRGSHTGSFEVAHGFRDGRTWAGEDSGERYDMVLSLIHI